MRSWRASCRVWRTSGAGGATFWRRLLGSFREAEGWNGMSEKVNESRV